MNKYTQDKFKFVILKPSGNDTALVSGIINNPKDRKKIADTIQQIYPNVEQVGFINHNPDNAELMMTGGEFCGNATSSAAFHILSGQSGDIKIKVSGVKNRLSAGVTKNGEGFSQMPVYPDPSYLKQDPLNKGNFMVLMEGITHYVDFEINQIKGLSNDEIKLKARQKMRDLGIDKNKACGIIFAQPANKKWKIYPVVYVRDADTLFYETACASGTTALGLILAQRQGESINEMSVRQPSGLIIKVSVEFNGFFFGYTQIQSQIKKISQGILELDSSNKIATKSTSRFPFHFPFFELH